jgi:NADP-dependent 3-hydroxy acid dehydrogenase YdfG
MTANDQAAKPLKGRVALVTGASSGIGEATAFALAAAGAKTAIVARRAERLAAVAERIAEAGGEALALAADAALESEAKRTLGEVENRFGRLDILVNNAGVMLLSPVAEAEIADFRRMIEINLFGLMTLTRLALPIMKRGGAGHFVNISSVAGRVANPGSAGYAATKFGVGAFSESLRREVYKDKIRVTVIEPGAVATELADTSPIPA